MEENRYSVILCYSSSYAVRAEKILAGVGIECKMIPIPRHLSSSCGVCVRIRSDDRNRAQEVLDTSNFPFEAIHGV